MELAESLLQLVSSLEASTHCSIRGSNSTLQSCGVYIDMYVDLAWII